MDHFLYILPAFLFDLPLFLVKVIGIVLAVIRRDRHPRASLFAAAGLSVMLVIRILKVLASTMLPVLLMDSMGGSRLGTLIGVVSLLLDLVEAVGLALLVAAVFMRRKETVVPPAGDIAQG